MVVFPHAKINLGLWVTAKRSDGFHDLETVFYPVALTDRLDLTLYGTERPAFICNATWPAGENEADNLCCKAYRLLAADYDLPPVRIELQKYIPVGAGLGGGSSDAVFTLKALNELCRLDLSVYDLKRYAARLGSDCAFFVESTPAIGLGKGDNLFPIDFSLSGLKLLLVKPAVSVSTAVAYSAVHPMKRSGRLIDLLFKPVETWKDAIVNDFEPSVFARLPEIGQIKQLMYAMGAVYAAMSGSGSCVYGLFRELPDNVAAAFPGCFVWNGQA